MFVDLQMRAGPPLAIYRWYEFHSKDAPTLTYNQEVLQAQQYPLLHHEL